MPIAACRHWRIFTVSKEFFQRPQKLFQVAREIGIDSKAIVAKCKAENVPNIDNHLSVVSATLAAKIKEWFCTTASAAEQSEQSDEGTGHEGFFVLQIGSTAGNGSL
ncbi:MAG: hypothetical protein ACP5I8_12305 [Phycisphaerae bacterium]